MAGNLLAGSAVADITPKRSLFLYGYPHVARYSTGVHDPLLASALYLSDGSCRILFLANDLIFIPRPLADRLRARLEAAEKIPAGHIMVTATHTHSGPSTVAYLSNEADSVVPPPDPEYLVFLEDALFDAAVRACRTAQPVTVGLVVADATGVGTNRRDPNGPADREAPVLMVWSAKDQTPLAAMIVCCMHPTVLHEDSTLISGDFPAMTRRYLQRRVLGENCPVLYHTGPSGNQSPRHVTRAHTFQESQRLGEILGRSVERAIAGISPRNGLFLAAEREFVELIPRTFPSVEEAEERLQAAVRRLADLRARHAPAAEIRTAECDWFGAEETRTLAQAARDGRLATVQRAVMPAEVQVLCVGPWAFVGWPGEVFVEYGLAVKRDAPNTFVITLANGELQGYLVTPEAAAEGGYEASNALFAAESGQKLVETTRNLLRRVRKEQGE